MNEDQIVERLRVAFSRPSGDVRVGIGDDAAVLAAALGDAVLSVDASIEGVHFRRAWADLETIGRRAMIAAMSDLAAMGARPRAALVALAMPAPSVAEIDALARGLAAGADACGAQVVGGNLARASELSITTTVVGTAPGAVLTRSGARPGDRLYVTGTVGAAALGLAALVAERAEENVLLPFVRRWREPHARVMEGQRLLALASAALDLSDGLGRDASRLARASGVGLRIELDALPLEPGAEDAAAALGLDARELALSGGEDYELLFTAPLSASLSGLATAIGEVTGGGGVSVTLRDGRTRILGAVGHDHFERDAGPSGLGQGPSGSGIAR